MLVHLLGEHVVSYQYLKELIYFFLRYLSAPLFVRDSKDKSSFLIQQIFSQKFFRFFFRSIFEN